MTEIEKRILQNQTEIMWALSYLLERASPSLVGKGGLLDQMRVDLGTAVKDTGKLMGYGFPK